MQALSVQLRQGRVALDEGTRERLRSGGVFQLIVAQPERARSLRTSTQKQLLCILTSFATLPHLMPDTRQCSAQAAGRPSVDASGKHWVLGCMRTSQMLAPAVADQLDNGIPLEACTPGGGHLASPHHCLWIVCKHTSTLSCTGSRTCCWGWHAWDTVAAMS